MLFLVFVFFFCCSGSYVKGNFFCPWTTRAASKFPYAIWLTSIPQELGILTYLKDKWKIYTAVFRQQVMVSLVQWTCIFSQFLYYLFCSYDGELKQVLSSKGGKRRVDIRSLILGSIWKKNVFKTYLVFF